MAVVKRQIRTRCPDERCGHMHAEGEPCHVFVPTWKWVDREEPESESSTESEPDTPSDMDEEEMQAMQADMLAKERAALQEEMGGPSMLELAGMGAKSLLAGAKKGVRMAADGAHAAKMTVKRMKGDAKRKLTTPDWARKCQFRRCNCDYGVPNNDVNFLPVPSQRFVGNICINTGECAEYPPWRKQLEVPVDVLRGVLPFLNARSIAHAARVCRMWSQEAPMQVHYHDMCQCEVVVERQAHDRAVQSVMQYRGKAFTSGDSRVNIWQMADLSVELVHTCARDTSPVTCCFEAEAMLYTGSANGAVREWSLPHDIKKLTFRSSMWEHNSIINGMAHWRMGGKSHLFTVADDRACRVWDLEMHRCIGILEPHDRLSATIRSVTCSDSMIFLGSSNGLIYVYLTETGCRRKDRHVCSLPEGPVPYCLQTTLKHGDDIVSSLDVGGFHHSDDLLFSGSYDGSVWVRQIPEDDLDFQIMHKFEAAHARAVTSVVCSWAHLLTAGDDGALNIYNLYSLDWAQSLEKRLRVEGRIKCMHIADEEDIEKDVAFLLAGTNRGQLLVIRLGAYV